MIVESMRSCQKHSFTLGLKILIALAENSLLSTQQFADLLAQVREIGEVIEHRRLPNPEVDVRERKIDEEITSLVSSLRKFQ